MLHTKHVDLMNSLQPNLQHPSFVDPRWHQFAKDYQKEDFVCCQEIWKCRLSLSTKNVYGQN